MVLFGGHARVGSCGTPPRHLGASRPAAWSWAGTLLAPNAPRHHQRQLHGRLLAATPSRSTESGSFTIRSPAACRRSRTRTLGLGAVCTDPGRSTQHAPARRGRVAHTGDMERRTGAEAAIHVPAGPHVYFDVLGGDIVHHIVVTSGRRRSGRPRRRRVRGKIILTSGHRARPAVGAVAHSDRRRQRLHDHASISSTLKRRPSRSPAVATRRGRSHRQVAGGYRATRSPRPIRSAAWRRSIAPWSRSSTIRPSTSPSPTTSSRRRAAARASADAAASAAVAAARPAIPPSGPDLVRRRVGGRRRRPRGQRAHHPSVTTVGDVVSVTIRVRNLGPLPADAAVAREIPQFDPTSPTRWRGSSG